MTTYQGVPAGYSDSESEFYEEYDGYYFDKTTKERNNQKEKTEEEIFIDLALDNLRKNDVISLRELLDKGISKGFDIDSPLIGQCNMLYYACFYALPDVVKFLADERGANLDMRIEGETFLMIACSTKENQEDVLKVVKILCTMEPKLINRTNYLGENGLMLAAQSGNRCVVEYLIKIGESYENISNSGRNVLFYAIEGNHIDIAKMLLTLNIDLDIIDCYGYTAKKFAIECNALEISEIFPPDEFKYETPSSYLSYSNIESIIPNIMIESSVPSFFPDIVTLLRGMDCERYIDLFSQANISLEEFLTINEDELEKIGIPLPCQRKHILLGLHKFFNGKWTKKSIYIPGTIKSHLSPVDFIYIFSNILRQTIIMKSQLIYLKRLQFDHGIKYPVEKLTGRHLRDFHNHISELKRMMNTMKVTKRPLLIDKQTQSIECNMIKRSGKLDKTLSAFKIILPFALISTITFKLFFIK